MKVQNFFEVSMMLVLSSGTVLADSECSSGFQNFGGKCIGLMTSNDPIDPPLAEVSCQVNDAKILEVDDVQTRRALSKLVFEQCREANGDCPRICVKEKKDKNELNLSFGHEQVPLYMEQMNTPRSGFVANKLTITQPIQPGNVLHVVLNVPLNSVDIIELADTLLQTSVPSSKAKFIFQIYIHSDYTDRLNNNEKFNGLRVKTGIVTKTMESKYDLSGLTLVQLPATNKISGRIHLQIEFLTDSRMIISCPEIFGEIKQSVKLTDTPVGRYYFTKYYQQAVLEDVYIMESNKCSKKDYHEPSGNGYINCHWTVSTLSIPVYSCERPLFTACIENNMEDQSFITANADWIVILLLVLSTGFMGATIFFTLRYLSSR